MFVAGSLHLDVVVETPRLPAIDETVSGSSVAYRFGGKGGNQAVAAARMGAQTAMAGLVGRDEFGRVLLRELDAAGVDHNQVHITEMPSGMSVALVDANGDYGAVIVSGANLDLDGERVGVPETAGVLLLQNELPAAANLAIARSARKASERMLLILNAAPARPADPGLFELIDILIVNRIEAAALTGLARIDGNEAAAARKLASLTGSHAILTLGGDGLACCENNGGKARLLPAPAVTVKSTHGAGDMFVGTLASELARGSSLTDAMDFAQAAAALLVSTPADARSGITRSHVSRFQIECQPASNQQTGD